MSINSARRASAVLLGFFYLLALIAAAPLAYAGALLLSVANRGWRTQVAAGALLVGWLALGTGAAFVWEFVRGSQRKSILLGVAAGVIAAAGYGVAYWFGGRMLI
jgi:hypothetical protein